MCVAKNCGGSASRLITTVHKVANYDYTAIASSLLLLASLSCAVIKQQYERSVSQTGIKETFFVLCTPVELKSAQRQREKVKSCILLLHLFNSHVQTLKDIPLNISGTCEVLCLEMQVTQLVDITDVHVFFVDL